MNTVIDWKSPDEPPKVRTHVFMTVLIDNLAFGNKPKVAEGFYFLEPINDRPPGFFVPGLSRPLDDSEVLGWSEWPEPATERVEKRTSIPAIIRGQGMRRNEIVITSAQIIEQPEHTKGAPS